MLLIALAAVALAYAAILAVVAGLCLNAARGDRAIVAAARAAKRPRAASFRLIA